MATAEELLVSLNENDNIIIDENRFIKVPEKLKRIAVQYDHNIETVTFNGPRYWDDHDLSDMEFYINYMRADGEIGSYIVENVGAGSNFVDFQWTISEHVSAVKGKLSFLVCAKETDADGNILYHWNSELNTDLYVSAGLETQETILMEHPDIITQLLSAIDRAESIVSPSVTLATTSEGYRMTVTDSNGSKTYTIKHGATGPQGPTGAKGDKGDKGSTGATGPQGTSITSIARTSGTGASGSTDTYTITLSDGSTSEFKVYNGKDGSGAGDMVSTVYDPQNKQTDIFKYVDDKLCNPNLLRNWYFANPVNQRGDTTYSAPGYAIDGWTLGTSLLSVNIEGDGLRIEKIATGSFAFMYQYLSDLPEGKYTFSALITNAQGAGGSIFVYKTNTGADFTSKNRLGSIVTIENGVATCTFDYKYDEALPRLALVVGFRDNAGLNSSCKVIAAKLESGSTQTLARQDGVDASGMPIWALNEIPDYHEELLKCIQSTADASDEYANKVIYHTGNKPTSEEIGLSVAKDLYTLAASCSVAYDGTTQNTPGNGSEKVTDYTSGICHVFVGTTYRTLVCVSGNGHIYTNRYDGSTWSGWKKLYSEHNKPTAADVGAAVATTHNVQTYYTLNQIGLTFGAETMADIANALPDNSILSMGVGTQNLSTNEYPVKTNGTLFVQKCGANRVFFKFDTINSVPKRTFIGEYYNSWGGWTEVATTDYAVNKAGDTMTGGLVVKSATPQVTIVSTTASTPGRTAAMLQWSDGTFDLINKLDGNNQAVFRVRPETTGIANALQFYRVVDGIHYGTYNIYHTGNKPTAEDVGAASVVAGFSSLSFITAACTTEEFFKAMPLNSSYSFGCSKDNAKHITDLPAQYGNVAAWKGYNDNYCFALFESVNGDLYRYNYHSSAPDVCGWVQIATTDMIPTTAEDVGAAPTAHDSSSKTYGIGTSSKYGHVKVSDSTTSTSAASAGIAASPKAVKAAYDLAAAAVPNTTTVNNKALSSNITLSASDVGAVPNTTTVNNKALSSNITLSASDVGAVASTSIVKQELVSSETTPTTNGYINWEYA